MWFLIVGLWKLRNCLCFQDQHWNDGRILLLKGSSYDPELVLSLSKRECSGVPKLPGHADVY